MMEAANREVLDQIEEKLSQAREWEQQAAEAYRRQPQQDSRKRWLSALVALEQITAAFVNASMQFSTGLGKT